MPIRGNAFQLPFKDESIQCIVTSPPYWALRRYAGEQSMVWPTPAARGIVRCAAGDHDWQSAGKLRHHPDRCIQGKDLNGSGKFSDEIPRGEQGSKASRGEALDLGDSCSLCGSWRGAYGQEPTLDLYVEHTVLWMEECRRVLRSDGCLIVNIGDKYANDGKWGGETGGKQAYLDDDNRKRNGRQKIKTGLKPKDMCLIPFRVALAAQQSGWWVRSIIPPDYENCNAQPARVGIWEKPNPMPSSAWDRPTNSFEFVFVFTKSERYFWDSDAIAEPCSESTHQRISQRSLSSQAGSDRAYGGQRHNGPMKAVVRGMGAKVGRREDGVKANGDFMSAVVGQPLTRNARNVWTITTQPQSWAECDACHLVFPNKKYLPKRVVKVKNSGRIEYGCPRCGAWGKWVEHFATFPEEIPRRAILAATSQRGACRFCGSPWERVRTARFYGDGNPDGGSHHAPGQVHRMSNDRKGTEFLSSYRPPDTVGWTPTCKCRGQHGKTSPCLVLDPFSGSGTTEKVAIELGRIGVGVDVAYHEIQKFRLQDLQPELSFF